jgi:hypothetical protein
MNKSKIIFSLFIVSLLNGCAAYPIKRDNVLTTPTHFEIQVIKEPSKQKAQVVDEVKKYLGPDIADDYANQKVTEYANSQYDILEKNSLRTGADINAIIEGLICDNSASIFSYKYWRPILYCKVDTKESAGQFVTTASLHTNETRWTINGGNTYSSNAQISFRIEGSHSFKDGYVSGNISSIGYILNCFANGDSEVVKLIEVNDRKVSSLADSISSSTSMPIDFVSVITKGSNEFLKNRYNTKKQNEPKIEKNYSVDFATAKARLQRSLGDFKYENEKSAFVFSKKHHNNSITHKFVISLFPDKSNTVVEFSGEYSFLNDTFGGAELFGKSMYTEEMQSYIAQVSSLLKK